MRVQPADAFYSRNMLLMIIKDDVVLRLDLHLFCLLVIAFSCFRYLYLLLKKNHQFRWSLRGDPPMLTSIRRGKRQERGTFRCTTLYQYSAGKHKDNVLPTSVSWEWT